MRRVLRDPTVGSFLIQSDGNTGEPILLHSMLPISILERHRAEVTWVFLLDAQVRQRAMFPIEPRLRIILVAANIDSNERIRNHGYSCPSRSWCTRGPYHLRYYPRRPSGSACA